MSKQFDFIGIGDITTDAFIRLSGDDATVTTTPEGKKIKITFNFGDKIEYDFVKEISSVGNSPNAAVSAHRLGLHSALITDLGDDYHGANCLTALQKEGIATDFVKVHTGKLSNYHYVLWYEEERTILVKHEEYPYALPGMENPKWLYLSSLGEKSIPFQLEVASFVKNNPETKLSFQPGTFQIKLGYETLKDIYAVSELFFCNAEEAHRILGGENYDIKKLLAGIRELGPRIVVITDGPNGAYSYDGEEMLHMPMYPDPAPPIDRTGAGDSLASTFTVMRALGKSVREALTYAPINSMSVVQKVGAQEGLLTIPELEDWLKKAPKNYIIQKI
ncbi:MAG TPA: carbohydrate kinase family protein [Candidatus Paceibacterota bacterium]